MSRHLSTETFQMDIRSSPSQQHLDPLNSRSSSLRSQGEDDNEIGQDTDAPMMNQKKHKLDLYSIPVFLLEVLILCALSYAAQFIHFQYHNDSFVDGFYCDDTTLRQHYKDDGSFVQLFNQKQNEATFVVIVAMVPIILIIFCELVNSMFGALKFRQIRALCKCCKLHSITRRSIRFSGAFILGFLICMISCDILATTSGHLRPYFAQECPVAYQQCLPQAGIKPVTSNIDLGSLPTSFVTTSTPTSLNTPPISVDVGLQQPQSKPISASSPTLSNSSIVNPLPTVGGRSKRAVDSNGGFMQMTASPLERRWIDLAGQDLKEICQISQHTDTQEAIYKFDQLAKSWPSFPATLLTYSCLYLAFYLSFVGTARPFRMISSLIVVALLLSATGFNVLLVKAHYNHWDDVAAGAILAFVTVLFVLLVYLNRFKDTHYYENQKMLLNSRGRQLTAQDSLKSYSGDGGIIGNYKANPASTVNLTNGAIVQNGVDTNGSVSNNDLAMRYFQIPRANYRGAPRPISSLQQMRS